MGISVWKKLLVLEFGFYFLNREKNVTFAVNFMVCLNQALSILPRFSVFDNYFDNWLIFFSLQIPLHYEIIDVCFDLVTSITSSECVELSTLSDCVELLFVFYAVREKFLLDRIPSFYLCYKSLFVRLVRKCGIEEGNDPVAMATATHKMEK